ncbi:MAG: recombinase RecA [Planctomycetaceae bacterium]|nr:recombinase RecA [Planctomycetaceae bacterium]
MSTPRAKNSGPADTKDPKEAKEAARISAEKARALEGALGEIHKAYGAGSIMRLGGGQAIREIRSISSGALSLDLALGGGFPRGRIVEIFGPESSGKTTLTLHIVASAQREGGICAFVDAEHALDPSYARKLGVKLDDLLISQPDTGEQALEIVEALVRSNAVDVVVVDSVAALVPRAEIEGEMGDSFVGLQARLMSQALRKLTAAISKSDCLVVFINQIREKIGVMFGSPETTTGGRALKFYSSLRVDIRRIGQIKEGEDVVGSRTKVTVVKNKVAPPFRKVEFDILYDRGISFEGDLLDLGLSTGHVLKSGTWFSRKHPKEGEIRLGQGREKARQFLVDNPEFARELEVEIRAAVSPKKVAELLTAETPSSNNQGSPDGDDSLGNSGDGDSGEGDVSANGAAARSSGSRAGAR